jgi:uncharacterized membrane protein
VGAYNFDFKSVTVGFNPRGIHALRSGVIRRSIAWEDVLGIHIRRGMDYNNWLIMIILGGALTACGLALIAATNANMTKDGEWLVYFARFNAYSITLTGLGVLLIVLALRRTMVIEIETTKGWHRYSLREIVKRDKLRGLVFFVQRQLPPGAQFVHPQPA